jgi:RNA polymerase sigma-70 factor (ECF subfamily)
MARREPTLELPFFEGAAASPLPTARLRRVALRITRNAAAADDAVQSALEKALRHRKAFRGEAKPSTWLHRIVVNEALAWRRSEARRARHTEAAREEAAPAAGAQPLDELLLRERRERVLRALAGLRADERELLARFALDGGYGPWARTTRTRQGAAKTRAFRARQALRAALAEPEPGPQQQPPSAQGPRVSR